MALSCLKLPSSAHLKFGFLKSSPIGIAISLLLFNFLSTPLIYSQEETAQNGGRVLVHVFGGYKYENMSNVSGFSINRAHLGYAYQFDKQFSAKIILDRGRASTVHDISVQDSSGNYLDVERSDSEGSYYTMTLKFASLEWKATNRLRFQIGAVLQNHYITQERFWGYRYVAPTFQDRYFKTPSGDLGLIGLYKINDRSGFDLAVYNGEGFRKSQDDEGR